MHLVSTPCTVRESKVVRAGTPRREIRIPNDDLLGFLELRINDVNQDILVPAEEVLRAV